MKLSVLLAIFLCVASPVQAGTELDLSTAMDAFERAKIAMSNQVNALPKEKRVALWTQYYLALEHLQRMDIHHRMIEQRNEDRGEQFSKAYTGFTHALEELNELLPDSG